METSRRQALALTGGLAAAGATLSAALDVLAQADPTASGPTATSSVRYGAAVYDSELFHDAAFRALYARHCQVIVPGYFLKWESLHPARDRYDWANADASVALGKQLNAAVRGHTLVWHESMPKWALEISSTADAEKQLVTHIETVVARYRGTIRSWDVVNEPLHETASNANHYRPSVWYRHLGERYLEVAFRTAADTDRSDDLPVDSHRFGAGAFDMQETRDVDPAVSREVEPAPPGPATELGEPGRHDGHREQRDSSAARRRGRSARDPTVELRGPEFALHVNAEF